MGSSPKDIFNLSIPPKRGIPFIPENEVWMLSSVLDKIFPDFETFFAL